MTRLFVNGSTGRFWAFKTIRRNCLRAAGRSLIVGLFLLPGLAGATVVAVQAPVALVQGWNLVGNGSGTAIDIATFADTSRFVTVWKWVAAQGKWAFYSPALAAQGGTALADYVASRGYLPLTSIAGGEGFWVNASQTGSVNVPNGNAISATALGSTLTRGWNLVAMGETAVPKQFCDAQSGGVTTLWAWDASLSRWYFYAPSLVAQGGTALTDFITSKNYLDFAAHSKLLGAVVGFWVNKP